MDRPGALARLTEMVAADQRPVLPPASVGRLLDDFRVRDRNGNMVTDPGYVETWNLNAAAAEGWRRKAALVAGDFTFSADDASYSKGDVLANMERMAAMYAAKDVGVASFAGRERDYLTDTLMPNG